MAFYFCIAPKCNGEDRVITLTNWLSYTISSIIPFSLVKTKSRVFGLFRNRPLVGSVTCWKRKLSLSPSLNLVSGLLVFYESMYQFC